METAGPGARDTASGGASAVVISGLALLIIPFAIQGYSLSSIAHRAPSPSQQLVEFVKANFDTTQITPCWDNQTHSFFEAVTPGAAPTGYWSIKDLYEAFDSGKTLLVSDRCPRYEQIESDIGLIEVARFSGNSPLWVKTPDIRLYATPSP